MNLLEDLYQQALNSGISVEDFRLPVTVSAAALVEGKYYIGIDRSQIETSYEEAEHLAHELGHCKTDAFYREGESRRGRSERKAEEWAIRRIVPPARFRAACRHGCREVWEFAEELNLSCPFAEKVMAYYLSRPRQEEKEDSHSGIPIA